MALIAKIYDNLPATAVIGFLLLGAALFIYRFVDSPANQAIVEVSVPPLSARASAGKTAFEANCAACHGVNGAGSDKGPPLVHDIYNPGHHADESFYRAAKLGVRRHHWFFGNMPPQPQVTDRDLAAIIRYVRELQQANGIFFKAHRM